MIGRRDSVIDAHARRDLRWRDERVRWSYWTVPRETRRR